MYLVSKFNDMIAIVNPPEGSVCCVMKNGLLEQGETYNFKRGEWKKIVFYEDEDIQQT